MSKKDLIIIKRYQNRKLYDTSKSCYVTLDEVAEDVANNVDIRVVDNKTGRDITNMTLVKYALDKMVRESVNSTVSSEKMFEFVKKIRSENFEDVIDSIIEKEVIVLS